LSSWSIRGGDRRPALVVATLSEGSSHAQWSAATALDEG
jgi:hypothetical protein